MRPASTSSLWGTGSPSIAARRGRRTSSLRSLCRRGIPPSQEWGHRPILHPPSAPPGSGFRLPQRDESLGATELSTPWVLGPRPKMVGLEEVPINRFDGSLLAQRLANRQAVGKRG